MKKDNTPEPLVGVTSPAVVCNVLLGWIDCRERLPPDGEDYRRSIPVLATDGKTHGIACLHRWSNIDVEKRLDGSTYTRSWVICGPDEYRFDHRVTHWMPLPALPNVEAQR